jgi:hypothetical protein
MSALLRYGILLGCLLLLGLFLPATWELLRPRSTAVPVLGKTAPHSGVLSGIPSPMGLRVSPLAPAGSQVQGEAFDPSAILALHSIPMAETATTPLDPAEAVISPALLSGR